MDSFFWFAIALISAIMVIPPVLLFRPLVIALANRINGKQVNVEELKLLKTKVTLLEQQVMEMRGRMVSIEDSHEFSNKILEDVSKRSGEIEKKH